MNVIAKYTFTTGVVSMYEGEIRDIDENDKNYVPLLSEGYVEEYIAPIVPSGDLEISENGQDINVYNYARVDVSVSGGGGSSVFTDAVMHLVVNTADGYYIYGAFADKVMDTDVSTGSISNYDHPNGAEVDIPIALHDGKAFVSVCKSDHSGSNAYSVSGNVTDFGGGNVLVTGNFTLTLGS